MNLDAWIISLSSAALAIIMSVAAFFIKKWIDVVDETIKELSSDFKGISKQISSLEQSQKHQTENISQTIQTQLSAVKIYGKIDKIDADLGLIKSVVQGKLLPHAEKHADDMGRVILLEKNLQNQSDKLLTMFNVVKVLAEKKQPDQTPAQASKSVKAKA